MIKTKEDLSGSYAVRADKEVFELFMQKCEEFGLEWVNGKKPREIAHGECVCFNYRSDDQLGQASEQFYKSNGMKRLTLSDFKIIKTRTEWVKVEDVSLSELFQYYENEPLYYKVSFGRENYSEIETPKSILKFNGKNNVYRKVEKDIDWRDVANDSLSSCKHLTPACDISLCVTKPKSDDPQDLAEWEELQVEFLSMCHLVAELTEKPE